MFVFLDAVLSRSWDAVESPRRDYPDVALTQLACLQVSIPPEMVPAYSQPESLGIPK